jgi:hypothetical protein
MLLRSGKVYDSEFPYFVKDIMRVDNPLFGPIWDSAVNMYNNHMNYDFNNLKKEKEASALFREYIYQEIRKLYNASH